MSSSGSRTTRSRSRSRTSRRSDSMPPTSPQMRGLLTFSLHERHLSDPEVDEDLSSQARIQLRDLEEPLDTSDLLGDVRHYSEPPPRF